MINRLGFYLGIFLAVQSYGHAQVPGFFMKEEQNKVEIPFYSSNSLIIITAAINGNTPLNFLVDTGVRSNILFSKTLGDALGLEYSRRIKLIGADGTKDLMASISAINELDLGPIVGKLQSLIVLEKDFLELESVTGVPIYGIIGYEFFKFNPVKIDYDKGILTFYEQNKLKRKPLFYKKIPMPIENEKPYIEVKVKQANGSILYPKLLIDTGANHGLLLNRETTNKITLPPLFLETELGQSLGGVLFGFIGRVDYLKMGKYRLDDVLTSYPEETAFSFVIKNSGRQGSLGSEVLGRTRLIFDYSRERLFIRRANNFYSPFEFDMSGTALKKVTNEENRIYISLVRPGSPADQAGVEAYDEILSINRIPAFIWELSELVKLFRSEDGKEIELELRRYEGDDITKFKDVKVSFVLKKQI
jgi:predicted aspartyl protease